MSERDGFNIQEPIAGADQSALTPTPTSMASQTDLLTALQTLNLDSVQKDNVKTLLVSGGAGLAHKWLGPHIGSVLAAGAGAALSAFLGDRLLGPAKGKTKSRKVKYVERRYYDR